MGGKEMRECALVIKKEEIMTVVRCLELEKGIVIHRHSESQSMLTKRTLSDEKSELIGIEEALARLTARKEEKIDELNEKFKSLRASDYPEYYERIRKQVVDICQSITPDMSDYDLDNRLKLLCRLKHKLYNEKNDEVLLARKYNGELKWKIRQIESVFEKIVKDLETPIMGG